MILAPEYLLDMARNSGGQNRQIKAALKGRAEKALRAVRGAFFGSILGALNHLLWGDWMWRPRLAGGDAPEGGIRKSADLPPGRSEWAIARFRMDASILKWMETRYAVAPTGDLKRWSGDSGCEMARPVALCAVHMFNHQSHHRGQVRAMAAAAGVKGRTSDLALMARDEPWL